MRLRLIAIAGLGALLALGVPAAGTAPTKVPTETITVPPKPGPDAGKTPVDPHARPAAGAPAAQGAMPEVHYGTEGLPDRVKAMRARILDAVRTGEIDKLRAAITANELPPIFSINETGDPIDYLKTQSGDPEGREILAILWDLLEAGWVRVNAGTPQDMYVWPYFAEYPLERLESEQLVEVYRVLTASDFDEMRAAGRYLFYKVGIGPDGTWHYFKLGD